MVTPVIPPRASTVMFAVAPPLAVLPKPTPTSFAPCKVVAEPSPYPTPDDPIPTDKIEFNYVQPLSMQYDQDQCHYQKQCL